MSTISSARVVFLELFSGDFFPDGFLYRERPRLHSVNRLEAAGAFSAVHVFQHQLVQNVLGFATGRAQTHDLGVIRPLSKVS